MFHKQMMVGMVANNRPYHCPKSRNDFHEQKNKYIQYSQCECTNAQSIEHNLVRETDKKKFIK